MNWAILTSVFFLATFKFMFSAIPGAVADVPFLHTYLTMVAGGVFSSGIFYFLAELFMKISHNKSVKKLKELEAKGIFRTPQKIFTRINKFIFRIKLKIGIYGITFWAPFFLSIPIGSIVVAKFYGKKLITYPLMVIGIMLNGILVVSISYIFN